MRYIKADRVLPEELLQAIQEYVDGSILYIPRKEENRQKWGSQTPYRYELQLRNDSIRRERAEGASAGQLAEKYHLSEKSIYRILRQK